MDKQQFEQACYKQLVSLFKDSKAGKKDLLAKGRTQGFIYAGQTIGLISKQEGEHLMEKAHFDVFGMSPAERKSKKEKLKQALDAGDDDYISIPPALR